MRSLLLASTALTLATGVAHAQQLPALLNGYAVTPPWQVAGVNYAVGVPWGAALQSPSTISTPGVSVNAAARTVTVSGSGVTLSGYNFNGWGVAISPGAGNTTIQNSSFAIGANNAVPIDAATGSGNLTVKNSSFDGGSTTNGAAWALISYSGSGTFTAQYNSFTNAPEDGIDLNAGKMTANVTNNLFENLGTSPGSHPDPVQFVGVNSTNSTIAYNTIVQPSTSGMQGVQVQAQNGSTLTNTTVENNTIVAKGGQIGMSYSVAVIQNAGNTINGATVANNYIDDSGAYGAFYPPSGSNLAFGGNVNLSTGAAIPNPSGTSAATGSITASSVLAAVSPISAANASPAPATTDATASSAPAATGTAAPACAAVSSGSAGGSTLLGTETGDPTNGAGAAELASFTSVMGKPAAMDTYLTVGDPSGFASSAAYSAWTVASTLGTSATPVVGIPMAVSQGSADSDFKAIAGGAWNADLTASFQAYAAAGFKTLIIRPGWEMNGNWYPWSVTPSNAADFVAAFQQIASLAHSYSGMNIQVAWNPGAAASSTSYQSIFPGAQYVDSIGIDTYGAAGGTPDTMPLQTTTDPNTFTLQDAIAMAKANGKPLSLPETGAGPGDVAFPQNLASVISASGVPVSFAMLWDDSYGGSSNLNWSGDPASDAAWKAAFASISGNGGGTSCGSVSTTYTPRTTAITDGSGGGSGGGGGNYSPPQISTPAGTTPPASNALTPVPPVTTCAATAGGAATGNFTTSNGNIIAPDGSVFIAKGINVYDAAMGDAAQILTDFPGLNFIRLAAYSYQSPSAYQSFVSTMSAKNAVVEIEHHVGAGGGVPSLTGSALSAENAWFQSLASAFKGNPYVWFGTLNEPSGDGSLAAEQTSNYQTIRSAGNNSIIMLSEPINANTSGMTGVVADQHFYGWISNYSTDQTTVNNALAGLVSADQKLTETTGALPVLIGETGPSTNGTTPDANGQQVLTADQSSGLGNAYWNWASDAPQDNLTQGGQMTSYGQNIAAYIALIAAAPASIWSPSCLAAAAQATPQPTGSVTVAQIGTSQQQPAAPAPAPLVPDTSALDTQAAAQQADAQAAIAAAGAQAPANAAVVQQGDQAGQQADAILARVLATVAGNK